MNTNAAQNSNTTDTGTGGQVGSQREPGVTGAGTGTGTGATAAPGGVGAKIKGAYHVIHGMGDNVRGAALGAIDTATHKGGDENDEIARRGRVEMEQGLAAFRQPKSDVGPGHTSAGQAGSVTVGEPGTGPTMGGAASTQAGTTGQHPGPQAAEALSTTQQNRTDGGTGYNAPPNSTQTHPEAESTAAAHVGAGAGATSGNMGVTSATEDRNGGHGHQNIATGATGQYPPGPQGHPGEIGNHDQTSGSHGTRVDPENQNQGHGGYGQTEKHTTEQFASRATSVPQRGASQINDNGAPAYHHRDDAVTDLNARPGEKHGDGQISTASGGKIPAYDRNEAFETHREGRDIQGERPGDLHQEGLGQGNGVNREGMPGSYGADQDGDYKGQYER